MEDIDNWRKAGKIASEAREYAKTLVVKGAKLTVVTKQIEEKIVELGGGIAFPAQLSLNETAAHNYPSEDDQTIFTDQIIKIDIGVHIKGCIGDTATTVDLSGKNKELVDASREALDNALKIIKAGTKVSAVGKVIFETITKKGYRPIINLSGHGLTKYNVHDHPTIPNIEIESDDVFEEGKIYAIEPFATNGAGKIIEGQNANLFSLIVIKPVRSQIARKVMNEIIKLNGLPFSRKYITEKLGIGSAIGLKELIQNNVIHAYPPLNDKDKGLVSQAEHTILVTKDGCEILTK